MVEKRPRKKAAKRRFKKPGWLAQTLDWAIYQVAPALGTRRMATRRKWEVLDQMGLSKIDKLSTEFDYDDTGPAGSGTGENSRLQGPGRWLTSRIARDNELEQNLAKWRMRSRELYKTDGFCNGAIESFVANVWGSGIIPQPRLCEEDCGLPQATCDTVNQKLWAQFKRWSKQCDRDGQQSYVDVMRLALRNKRIDGESFIVRSFRPLEGQPLTLCLEVIDSDRVETPPSEIANKYVRMGIKRDEAGRIVSYYIRTTHPQDYKDYETKWREIPAADVLHDFDRLFPNQTRGMPWLAPVMPRIRDLKDFNEAQLVSEQVAACYSAFITGGGGDPEDIANGNLSQAGDTNDRIEDLEPGRVAYLNDGQTIEFSNPNRPGATLAPYMQWQLRYVAAGLNFPYELLVKDYRELSYSAGRMSLLDGRQMFRQQQQTTISRDCEPIWEWFVDACVIAGLVTEIDLIDYEADSHHYLAHKQQAPGWPWIDPAKEVQASKEAVLNDLSSLTDELAGRGKDFEDLMDERLAEKTAKLMEWSALVKLGKSLDPPVEEDTLIILFTDKQPPAPPPLPGAKGDKGASKNPKKP